MISVVLPTKNEPRIGELIQSIKSVLNPLNVEYEVITVDKSSDETPKLAELAGARIVRQKSDGLGNAIKEGISSAKGDIIIVMDADFSHDPKYIPKFIDKVREFDIVVGSRKVPGGGTVGWGWYREIISRGANLLARYVAGVHVSDATSGYRAYRKDVFNAINLESLKSKGFEFQIEVLSKALEKGFKVGSIPIVFRGRSRGKSKLSGREILRFLSLCLNLRWDKIKKTIAF